MTRRYLPYFDTDVVNSEDFPIRAAANVGEPMTRTQIEAVLNRFTETFVDLQLPDFPFSVLLQFGEPLMEQFSDITDSNFSYWLQLAIICRRSPV